MFIQTLKVTTVGVILSEMEAPLQQEPNCIFCRISSGNVGKEFFRLFNPLFLQKNSIVIAAETELLYTDNEYAVFRDYKPAAQHHYLVVPKRHFGKVSTLSKVDVTMLRRMETIGVEVLANRVGKSGIEDVKMGFHWPLCVVNHLHLHVIYPASQMSFKNRMMFSSKFFGDVASAIQHLESSE